MILFFNVFLTNSPGNPNLVFDRGGLPNYSKLEVTKYSLLSLVNYYSWSKVIINVEFDINYSKQEIVEFNLWLRALYNKFNLQFSNCRCLYQYQWKEIYSQLDDDLIFYIGNHDHIVVDNDVNYFHKLIKSVKQFTNQNLTVVMSHWPEVIRSLRTGNLKFKTPWNPSLREISIMDDFTLYDEICLDSFIIINKSLYFEWFVRYSWPDGTELPRTEGIGRASLITIFSKLNKTLPIQTVIVPHKELLRHFDGYNHQGINHEICNALFVPSGIWAGKIEILNREDYYNFHENYLTFLSRDDSGQLRDIKINIFFSELPYFWKYYIKDNLKDLNETSEKNLIFTRLKLFLLQFYSDNRYYAYVDDEVVRKILSIFLENLGNKITIDERGKLICEVVSYYRSYKPKHDKKHLLVFFEIVVHFLKSIYGKIK